MPNRRPGNTFFRKQNIIWAVNPFDERDPTRSRVIKELRDLSQAGAVIHPVYVLSPEEYEINVSHNARWLGDIQPTAEKVLAHSLKDISIPRMAAPEIIVETKASTTRAVKALLAHADISGTDAIVVGTHAKSALSRFLLGSFAETLLLYSSLPILVVGARSNTGRTQHRRRSRKILFPTDFRRDAERTFKKVVQLTLSKPSSQSLILFHRPAQFSPPLVQSGVYLISGGIVSFPELLTEQEARYRKTASKWIRAARAPGVKIDVHWGDGQRSTAQEIVDQARSEKVDYIAMAAQSGPISTGLIGSIARQVVRTAPCPVWVMRNSEQRRAS